MGFLKDVWLDPRCVWKTHGRQVVEKTAENCLRGMKEFMRTKAGFEFLNGYGIHQAGKWFLHWKVTLPKADPVCFLQSQRIFWKPHQTLDLAWSKYSAVEQVRGTKEDGEGLSGRCWGDYIGWVLKRLWQKMRVPIKPQIWDPRWSYSNHRSIIWVDNLKPSNKHSNGQLTVYRQKVRFSLVCLFIWRVYMNKKVPIYLQKHGTCVLALLFSGTCDQS